MYIIQQLAIECIAISIHVCSCMLGSEVIYNEQSFHFTFGYPLVILGSVRAVLKNRQTHNVISDTVPNSIEVSLSGIGIRIFCLPNQCHLGIGEH